MKLTIIRGIPGSGKSTRAEKISKETGAKIFEADQFFTDENGEYKFNHNFIKLAHAWCLSNTAKELFDGKSVIVANTFIRHWEVAEYYKLGMLCGSEIEIITMDGGFESVHNVPAEVIERMKDMREDITVESMKQYLEDKASTETTN